MRVLVAHPGADFSVADVFNGYVKALRRLGCKVATFNLSDRLVFFTNARMERDGEYIRAFDNQDAVHVAARDIHSQLYEWWPDLVLVISAFYITPLTWELLKSRPHKTAVLFTESPYEDDRQLRLVKDADPDLVLLNDPTNIEQYRAIHNNVHYFGHCYDPDIHHPGNGRHDADFVFVGTDYPSRRRFLEAIDWTGLDVRLAGHWRALDDDSPLRRYLIHDSADCYPNLQAANLYRGARTSANLYRGNDPSEANHADLQQGWAVGPREIELAACRTWFQREPRGESNELFPMLPTFTGPDDFSEQLRWAVGHQKERNKAAKAAHERIEARTFDAGARRLLTLIGD